jgi:hypothetical protein
VQLLELQLPMFLRRAFGIEIKTTFVELRFSLRIHYASFEDGPLIVDPIAQLWVFLVHVWHIGCKLGRETDVVLVRVLR